MENAMNQLVTFAHSEHAQSGIDNLHSTDSTSEAGNDRALRSILLVEADTELRDTRRLLFSALDLPVLVVSNYSDVCQLPADSNVGLIAISLSPSAYQAARIATHARKYWRHAKVLLLGQGNESFDDALYDDIVNPFCNPAGMLEASRNLLERPEAVLS